MGISKVEELANSISKCLLKSSGKMGLWLKQSANRINFEEVKEREGV
jgi:DNA polymerase IV (archaeal DinB-like DNA polymerase)